MASMISSSFAKPNGVPAALIYMPEINGSFFAFSLHVILLES